MHVLAFLISISIIIFLVGFHFSSWYYCPVCKQWFWLGSDATLCDGSEDTLILCHGEDSHHHTPGYHGLGGKPLTKFK